VSLEPAARDGDWLVALVALSAVMLVATEQPERLKVCGNPDCSWMFFDDTLNRSRIYCSIQPCGTLMRVRRFRAARKTAS
jgi:predicted RNA-binding Zn ribbon-like protein